MDNVQVDNGALTDYLVSSDEVVATGEHIQRMKLAYSADGVATHVPADADGLLVNLGANNDISGTVTANLGATDNAVLDDIAAKLATIDADTSALAGAIAGTEAQVDVVSSALPTGASTAAKQPALGTAGTPSADVISIQGVASGTVVPVADGGGSLTVDGTFWQATQPVSLASVPSHAVTNAGTFATQVDGAALTALQLIDNASATHDSSVVTGVTQTGLDARSTDPVTVGGGDAVRALATLLGKQVVYPHALPGATWQYAGPTGGITDTADDVIQAAGGAGVRHYLTDLTVINAHATVGTEVVIKDGSTVIHRGWAAAAGGGYTITFNSPLRGTAATALNVACITTGSATVVSASGFSAAE